MNQKIFCIGFHKTGTSSLAKALNMLGFKVCRRLSMLQEIVPDLKLIDHLKKNEYHEIIQIAEEFDAFVDNPWPLIFKELDQNFPDCKFILTTRNEENWIESVCNYFKNSSTEIREIIYGQGSPIGNEELYLTRYREHNKNVQEYFENKPNKLLILDLIENDKWNSLCNFLKVGIPKENFPHENKTQFALKPQKKYITLKGIQNFSKIPFKKKLFALTLFIYLFISRCLILILPFRKLAPHLGDIQKESSKKIAPDNLQYAKELSKMIKKVSFYTPFRSLCFEQALTAKFLLNKKNIEATTYFGLNYESKSNLKAHAWTRTGNFYVTGNKGKEKFKVISTFS
ncbi:MAG: hypothetical protein ACI9DK_002800 [Vicingaceae bacterium]|jgi:hypothetical protein